MNDNPRSSLFCNNTLVFDRPAISCPYTYSCTVNFIFTPVNQEVRFMPVISKSKSDNEVGKALSALIHEINKGLGQTGGLISNIECDVTAGPFDATVSISVFIDGDAPREKHIIGVNEKGYSRENSMAKAEKQVNSALEAFDGTIAGSYVTTMSSLPGRVYTTIIVALNGEGLNKNTVVDSEVRRKRIKKGLELLGNDPTVINVARLANTFGVSRTMIYKDLEYLGFKRS